MKKKLVGLAIVGLAIGYGFLANTQTKSENQEIAMSSCTKKQEYPPEEKREEGNKCSGSNECGKPAPAEKEEHQSMAPKRKSAAQKVVFGAE